MPDGVEVLAPDCEIVSALAVPTSGVVRISSTTEARFAEAPIPPGIPDADIVRECASR